jgi:hypothetical protein
MVPTKGDVTLENNEADTPEKRHQLYGQPNRVRLYGKLDFLNKLTSAGFEAKIICANELIEESEFKKFGFKNKFLYSVKKI